MNMQADYKCMQCLPCKCNVGRLHETVAVCVFVCSCECYVDMAKSSRGRATTRWETITDHLHQYITTA